MEKVKRRAGRGARNVCFYHSTGVCGCCVDASQLCVCCLFFFPLFLYEIDQVCPQKPHSSLVYLTLSLTEFLCIFACKCLDGIWNNILLVVLLKYYCLSWVFFLFKHPTHYSINIHPQAPFFINFSPHNHFLQFSTDFPFNFTHEWTNLNDDHPIRTYVTACTHIISKKHLSKNKMKKFFKNAADKMDWNKNVKKEKH